MSLHEANESGARPYLLGMSGPTSARSSSSWTTPSHSRRAAHESGVQPLLSEKWGLMSSSQQQLHHRVLSLYHGPHEWRSTVFVRPVGVDISVSLDLLHQSRILTPPAICTIGLSGCWLKKQPRNSLMNHHSSPESGVRLRPLSSLSGLIVCRFNNSFATPSCPHVAAQLGGVAPRQSLLLRLQFGWSMKEVAISAMLKINVQCRPVNPIRGPSAEITKDSQLDPRLTSLGSNFVGIRVSI